VLLVYLHKATHFSSFRGIDKESRIDTVCTATLAASNVDTVFLTVKVVLQFVERLSGLKLEELCLICSVCDIVSVQWQCNFLSDCVSIKTPMLDNLPLITFNRNLKSEHVMFV